MATYGVRSALVVVYSLLAAVVAWFSGENRCGMDTLLRTEWPVDQCEDDINAENAVRAAREQATLLGHTPVGELRSALVFSATGLARQWRIDCESCRAYIDADSGELRGFILLETGDEETLTSKSRRDAIPRERAIELAGEIGDKLGVHVDQEKLVVRYEDTMDMKPGDLLGASWSIIQYGELDGIKSFDSGLIVLISALDGSVEVVQLGYRVTGLTRAEWAITRDEALELVSKAIPSFDMGRMEEVGLKIVNPMLYWMAHERNEPVLCWIWQERDPGGGLTRILFVNARSGRVHVVQ